MTQVDMEIKARAAMQEKINRLENPTVADILFIAQDAHKAFPQYDGVFTVESGWKLAVMTIDLKTKAGTAFLSGDIVIAKRRSGDEYKVYSVRNRLITGVMFGVSFLE